jgi:hypothetical protein
LVVLGGYKKRNGVSSKVELRAAIGKMKMDSEMPAEYNFDEKILSVNGTATGRMNLRHGSQDATANLESFLRKHGFQKNRDDPSTFEITVGEIFTRALAASGMVKASSL